MNEPQITRVNIGLVDRPAPPIREEFDEVELHRLIASIRENGILVPLMVVRRGDRFEVVDGDRRLKAAWEADVREIPVVVHALDDHQIHIQRMLANLDRHDTDPVSEAKYVAKLVHKKTFTLKEIAQKLGRTMSWVEGRMTIAEMPEYMQEALSKQKISLGVCMELHQIKDERTKEQYFRSALRDGMTVHAARFNRMNVNEAIESLQSKGEEVEPQNIPTPATEPQVICALTDETRRLSETRMVRVGIRALEVARANMAPQPTPTSRENEV